MVDLKPCPFCGSKAELFQSSPKMVGHNDFDDEVGVRCTVCDVKTSFSNYANFKVAERENDAVKWWNTRA